jgi:hypothetical protein
VERLVEGYVPWIERSREVGERLCTGDREKWKGWWDYVLGIEKSGKAGGTMYWG